MPISTISTGGIADSINIDNGTLVVDGVNNRVGIGTSSPTKPLTVFTSAATDSARFTDNTNSELFIKHSSVNLLTLATGSTSQPMAFGQGSTEHMRIDTSGNLLVGKTSTGLANQGAEFSSTGQVKGTAPNQVVGYFNRTSSDGSILEFRKDNTTVGSIGVKDGTNAYIGSGASGFAFASSGPTITPYNTTANNYTDNTVDLGNSFNRFKDLYLSGGVYLGGIAAANYLDDYEEGTWTPVIDSNAFSSITYSRQFGTYTKVGNLVTAYITLQFSGTSVGGNFRINGLPFATANDNTAKGMFIVYSSASTYLDDGNPNMYIGPTQTYIRAYKSDGNEANSNANASSDWFEGVVVYNAA